MLSLPGRLYGPGLPGAGVPVEARLDALQLRIGSGDDTRSASLSQLSLRRAGFDQRQIEISWTEGAGRFALLVEDPAVVETLLTQAPASLRGQGEAVHRQRRRDGLYQRIAVSAVVLWVALPLIALLLLLAAARPIAGWVAGWVPVRYEQQLGEAVFAHQQRQLQLLDDGAAQHAVQQIGERLTRGSRYRYQWHVARDPSLNAFAIPGGIVVVHSGLISAAADASELAGVLAHEVEHVEQRHSLKALVQQTGLRLLLSTVVGDVGVIGDWAGQLGGLKFSRDSERQADDQGLDRLLAAGFDADGMLRLFAKLDASPGNGVTPPGWLSSHPATPERIARLRQRLEGRPATPMSDRAPAIDWPSVQRDLAADRRPSTD